VVTKGHKRLAAGKRRTHLLVQEKNEGQMLAQFVSNGEYGESRGEIMSSVEEGNRRFHNEKVIAQTRLENPPTKSAPKLGVH